MLELATAEPPKKKKPRPSLPPPQALPKPIRPLPPHQTQLQHHHHRHAPRQSLPSNLVNLPPTPSTGLGIANAPSSRIDPYTTPLHALLSSLPSPETQQILFSTFFNDPFFTEGISLLQPQFLEDFRGVLSRRSTIMRDGDATCLANAFVFLASSLKVLPEETGKLLLAQIQPSFSMGGNSIQSLQHHHYQSNGNNGVAQPRSFPRIIATLPPSLNDPTPLDQRYLDLALLACQVAEQNDAPSVMMVMFKLILHRYCLVAGRKAVLAGGWLSQGIKVAQALGMGKEWEGLPQGERELRRRVMWTLYCADRQQSL